MSEIFNPANIAIFFIALAVLILGVYFHFSKDTNFELQQLVTDSVTNKLSPEKTTYMGAFVVGSWAMITQVQKGTLSEWFLVAYLGTFAASRGISQAISVWNKKEDTPKS